MWFQTCWSVKVKVLVAQLCLTLFHPMDCSMPGSSVHGISQAEILEWVAIPFSRGSSQPRDGIWVSWIVGRFFTIWATREAQSARKWKAIIFNDKNEVLTKLQDSLFLSRGQVKHDFISQQDNPNYTPERKHWISHQVTDHRLLFSKVIGSLLFKHFYSAMISENRLCAGFLITGNRKVNKTDKVLVLTELISHEGRQTESEQASI